LLNQHWQQSCKADTASLSPQMHVKETTTVMPSILEQGGTSAYFI